MRFTEKLAYFDTIIIGAGIAGACVAYRLHNQNQKILVLDKKGIASGGSGSAGAFISPKIGKYSKLLDLTNEAFEYAKDFYYQTTPQYFHQTGLIRLAKDRRDSENFSLYESANSNRYVKYSQKYLERLGIKENLNHFCFSEAGDCDALEVCQMLLKDIKVRIAEVKEIGIDGALYAIGVYRAKNIILATGYENSLLNMDYMGVSGIWGQRGDFNATKVLKYALHQSLSISASRDNSIKIGATHHRDITIKQPCDKEEIERLKEEASSLIDTTNFLLKKSYCGMRAGSKDYFPLVGKIIDVAFMLEHYPLLKKGAKAPLRYKKNIYILNGLGGRGFVFAPLMAKMLCENMLENKEIDSRVNPDRLFFKWCRKLA